MSDEESDMRDILRKIEELEREEEKPKQEKPKTEIKPVMSLMHLELYRQLRTAMFNHFIKAHGVKIPYDGITEEQIMKINPMIIPQLMVDFENYLRTIRHMKKPLEKITPLFKDISGLEDPLVMEAFRKLKRYEESVRIQNQHIKDGIGRKIIGERNERIQKQFEETQEKLRFEREENKRKQLEKQWLREEKTRKIIEETKHKELIKHNKKTIRETIKEWNKYVRKEFDNIA